MDAAPEPHAAADKPAAPNAGAPPIIEASMLGTVCPQGGFHEWAPVRGDNDFVAGLAAGACSSCLFCLWWPLLLCAPACYFGGRELSKDFSDKECAKCHLVVDRKGHLKDHPKDVPEKNPVSGQPNAFYGWSTGGRKQE